jgi:hypothetical protein
MLRIKTSFLIVWSRFRRESPRILFCAGLVLLAFSGGATAAERAMFFASPGACVGSTMFKKAECDNAFANAAAELRRGAGEAMSRVDCVLRFGLCEKAGTKGGTAGYAPVMLGVELRKAGAVWTTRPTLALESAHEKWRAGPISRLVEAEPDPAAPVPRSERPDAQPSVDPHARPVWLSSVASAFVDEIAAARSAKALTNEQRARERRREEVRNAPIVY